MQIDYHFDTFFFFKYIYIVLFHYAKFVFSFLFFLKEKDFGFMYYLYNFIIHSINSF